MRISKKIKRSLTDLIYMSDRCVLGRQLYEVIDDLLSTNEG